MPHTFKISKRASIDGKSHTAIQVTGWEAGENLEPLTPVTVTRVGKKFIAKAAKPGDYVDGVNPLRAVAGAPVTVMGPGTRFHADDAGGLQPGAGYGITNTAGYLSNDGTVPLFRAVSPTDLQMVALGKTEVIAPPPVDPIIE